MIKPTPFDLLMIRRCLKIASFGGKNVKSNPQVGAIITFGHRIIGEGWHKNFGGLHAEREALAAVKSVDLKLLTKAHLYVSLEPCNHQGKTPPCVDAILKSKIPEVTIALLDPTTQMSGKSVDILRNKGIKVNVIEKMDTAKTLLAPFHAQHIKKRPFILLKYAISRDGYIGQESKQIWLSNRLSKLSVHRTRSQVDAIMIGTKTAIVDNPRLTTRLVNGHSPLRVILDRYEKIPKDAHLLTDEFKTLIITTVHNYKADLKREISVLDEAQFKLPYILQLLLTKGINSIMVEGGKTLLNNLIKEQLWDECHLYKTSKELGSGIKAPYLRGKLHRKISLDDNRLLIINNLYD